MEEKTLVHQQRASLRDSWWFCLLSEKPCLPGLHGSFPGHTGGQKRKPKGSVSHQQRLFASKLELPLRDTRGLGVIASIQFGAGEEWVSGTASDMEPASASICSAGLRTPHGPTVWEASLPSRFLRLKPQGWALPSSTVSTAGTQ